MIARTAYCAACMCQQPLDRNWRALWIDSDGDLRMGSPEKDADPDFERPGTVFACGELSALVLTERYLHGGSFAAAHDLHLDLQHDARNHFANL